MRRKRPASEPRRLLARLDDVRERGDRRATGALLELVCDATLSSDRRADAAGVLASLEDVRCAPLVEAIVLDPQADVETRSMLCHVHAGLPVDAPPRETSLARSRSPDFVVRAFGVRSLDAVDGDALVAAAHDPEALVRYAAIDATTSLARTPQLVAAVVRAFSDEDAAIRVAACRAALFDEPLDAASGLVRLLADPSKDVRMAACDALEDYPRVSVLLALADARGEGEDGIAAELAFAVVSARILRGLAEASPRARRRLERWIEPVRWLLDEVARPPAGESDGEPHVARHDRPPVHLEAAAALLDDPDAPGAAQRALLTSRSWSWAGRRGRDVVRRCAASPNWALRQATASAFADLGAKDELLVLAGDREGVVRGAAFEQLLELGEKRALCAARATLEDETLRASAGDAALQVIDDMARHAEVERVVLGELERTDDRDGLLLGALHIARNRNLDSAEPALLEIAAGPVLSSVIPHCAALVVLRDLGASRRRVDFASLESIDHLDVQRELGEWGVRGGRYG